ncbi:MULTISPECIES: hypothetical protein [Deefgea]|uniref:Uncharacterized protein n=1 Tax=Deefgea chitinilytica TaxID=570276 RepID=A0ABS2CFL7_9NEIS|nr:MULTISPECIES: hypothetical protein [Deefgea]MBM5572940.1 hypothetical protein [Deefgea chitinilytica]MBM9890176.1 hypothetical protein [Deefgea sp. CFH1-16]
MNSIHELGKEHLQQALQGKPEALSALFHARVSGWGKIYAHEEEMTVGLFSDLEQKIEPAIAFSLLSNVVELAESAADFDRFNCALDLMSSLVIASETTEIPLALQTQFSAVENKALRFGGEPCDSIAVIRKHYRNEL